MYKGGGLLLSMWVLVVEGRKGDSLGGVSGKSVWVVPGGRSSYVSIAGRVTFSFVCLWHLVRRFLVFNASVVGVTSLES